MPNPPVLSQISAAAEAQCGKARSEDLDLPEAYHMQRPHSRTARVDSCCASARRSSARKIDLVLLSIGGNDVGFSRLVANAVLADQSTLKGSAAGSAKSTARRRRSRRSCALDARYKSLNRAMHNLLHMPWEESDRIILTGYPGMALTGDGSELCRDGRAGMEVVPDFRLSEQKLRRAPGSPTSCIA